MGLFSFIQSAGEAIGLLDSAEEKKAKADAIVAEQARADAQSVAQRNEAFAQSLKDSVARLGLAVTIEAIAFHEGVVTVRGTAQTQAAREKAILTLGNVQGVSSVHESFDVLTPEPESTLHTVERGDLLSKVADQHYGSVKLFNLIFEANRPMLTHPDKIYPGQVLRVPAAGSFIRYTVERGDTLGKIAKHFYMDASRWTEIQAANKLSGDAIDVGQVLDIPVPSAG